MSEILFLSHRVPFPPDRGDKIRSHHLLKALARLAPVHVGTLGETDDDMAQEAELAALASSHCFVRRRPSLALAGIEALARREPVSLAAFRSAALQRWVRDTLASRPVTAIYVFSGQMGQYVPTSYRGRVIMDLVDVDSAKFEAYAEESGVLRGWIDAREGELLRAIEAKLVRRADATLLVSDPEAALLRSRLPDGESEGVAALGNGIDADFFDPASVSDPSPYAGPGPHFVFTGQMDYSPNIAACRRAVQRIIPSLRQHHPDAAFHIVGRAPTDEVTAMDRTAGVKVWGGVPNMRPFLAHADLVMTPLTIARGVQNKVLEAMAMARPVLLSEEAATGIGASDGLQFRIAQDDSAFIAEALALIAAPERCATMGNAARRFVIEHRSWSAMLAPLAGLTGFAAPGPEAKRDAA